MRKDELFAHYRAVCAEVKRQDDLRWLFPAIDLLKDREIIHIYNEMDFPGEGWGSTGICDLIRIGANPKSSPEQIEAAFEEIWASREMIMQTRREEASTLRT